MAVTAGDDTLAGVSETQAPLTGAERGDVARQLVRLRLPQRVGFLYVMRQFSGVVDEDRFPGAEPLLSSDGRVLAARGPHRLLELSEQGQGLEGDVWPTTLVLDVRRAARAVQRPVHLWSTHVRGDIVEFDDLCWDAAATTGDDGWAAAVRSPTGSHQLYDFVWGDTTRLPAPGERSRLLVGLADAFVSRVKIV